MKFQFQESTNNELKTLFYHNKHSILLVGSEGSGKTYLAGQCGKFINTVNIVSVQSNVTDIRTMIDTSYSVSDNILIIVENLDESTSKSAYTLLKFLEEPRENVYIIITCRNIRNIPDTIVSRSEVVNIGHPNQLDIVNYAKNRDEIKYNSISNKSIWKIVRSFSDVDKLYTLDSSKLDYFEEVSENLSFKDTISNMLWTFTHYKDNSDIELSLMIRYILYTCKDMNIQKFCIQTLQDIQQNRVSQFAIMSKFLFECKYGGGQ